MVILIDTHVWWWLMSEPARLSSDLAMRLADPGESLLLSSISVVEVAIKVSVGKLALDDPLEHVVTDSVQAQNLTVLPFELRHPVTLGTLPLHHRDPFDRMLIA